MGAELVLVTGISGFIGKHCALELLSHGYRVRGTIRDAGKEDAVRSALEGHCDTKNLEFAQADLLADGGWPEATVDVDHVLHVASPFPLRQPKDPEELVRPAREGALRVLAAAAKQKSVRTVVQTSSVAAVYGGHTDRSRPFTEADWTYTDRSNVNPYALSKTLAERAGREFVEQEKPDFRYLSINPGLVFGPLLDRDYGSSAEVVRMLLKGAYPGLPRLQFGIIDVRDVAKAHRLALERGEPGGRYIASAGSLWMIEIAAILRRELGADAKKVPLRQLPDALVRFVGLFDSSIRATLQDLGLPSTYDTDRIRKVLGMEFRSAEEAVVAMGRSLVAAKLV